MTSVPLHTALNEKSNCPQHCSQYYHRMQTHQTALEEILHRECLSPTVIIRIANDKPR